MTGGMIAAALARVAVGLLAVAVAVAYGVVAAVGGPYPLAVAAAVPWESPSATGRHYVAPSGRAR